MIKKPFKDTYNDWRPIYDRIEKKWLKISFEGFHPYTV